MVWRKEVQSSVLHPVQMENVLKNAPYVKMVNVKQQQNKLAPLDLQMILLVWEVCTISWVRAVQRTVLHPVQMENVLKSVLYVHMENAKQQKLKMVRRIKQGSRIILILCL